MKIDSDSVFAIACGGLMLAYASASLIAIALSGPEASGADHERAGEQRKADCDQIHPKGDRDRGEDEADQRQDQKQQGKGHEFGSACGNSLKN